LCLIGLAVRLLKKRQPFEKIYIGIVLRVLCTLGSCQLTSLIVEPGNVI
jgi:hypothetical protein